jgi:hypothetical protein
VEVGPAQSKRAAKIPHPSGDDGHDDAGWVPATREEARELLGEGIYAALRKAVAWPARPNQTVTLLAAPATAYHAIDAMGPEDWATVLDFALDGLTAAGYSIVRSPQRAPE